MGLLKDADRILENAETELRELIQLALSEQQYADVAAIAQKADMVARLLRSNGTPAGESSQESTSRDHAESAASQPASRLPTSRTARTSRKRTPPKGEYPRFEREGDKLVKIGWSKRDGRVYEHRAPRDVVHLVTHALSSKVKPKSTFTMDQILPLNDNGGSEVPSYQAYLALAWLRSIGVVQRRGKDGYTVANASLESSKLERLWNAVPSRN